MEPLGGTANIISVLQLSAKVLGYLNDVKDAPRDRAKCAIKLSNLHSLLVNLRFRLEEGSADTAWYAAVLALVVKNEPLHQFKQALEQLQNDMTGENISKTTDDALVWRCKEDEVTSMLGRMERLKILVETALQMDHLILPQGIKDDTGLDRMHGATIRYDQGMTQQYQNHTISSPGLHHYPPILPAQNFGLSAYPFFLNEETPPFNPQETWYTVTCEGKTITPTINAKIEKGFFYSGDQVWTCYRRNYFSVHVSFTLDPWISHGRLCLDQNGTGGPEDVHSMAVSLSAAIDNASGKRIELVQLTPKHDKGPQHEVMKKDLKPTLPRKSYRNGSYDTNKFYQSTTIMGPQVPLKRESNPSCQEYSPTSHTNNNYQHTFEKMQFKSATAKNGKRKAQQQYFCLIVELWVSIQNSQDTSPVWVKIGSRCSHPVVVRGRSPSRYSVSQ